MNESTPVDEIIFQRKKKLWDAAAAAAAGAGPFSRGSS